MINGRKTFWSGIGFVAVFVIWTLLVRFLGVKAIGPLGSSVGFAKLNGFVHEFIGVNMQLYAVTDWLGLVPIGVAVGFGVLGLTQWIKRKSLAGVDFDIFGLGVFYVVVIAVYILFELIVVNYRPVLINGYLEGSYPSSTTMLALCVMPTAIMQFRARIKNKIFRRCVTLASAAFTAFMVVARIISGVHWITDIIGGILVSAGLVLIYYSVGNINGQEKRI